jgi:hypothetical protein
VCWFESSSGHLFFAEVVKLVDTHVSGACGASYAGSSPAFGTLSAIDLGCFFPQCFLQ